MQENNTNDIDSRSIETTVYRTPPILPGRQYKDRLFKAIFGRKEHKPYLLSLYNALNGTSYTNPDDLELTTIENIIYITMKNDVSFLLDSQMNLYEQQSSFNPNMPLRGLMYFAQLYQKHISKQKKDLYSSTLLKIPSPRFIVIYIGSKELDDVTELRLSDAFEVPDKSGRFEWTATVVNINKGHNAELLEQCKPLSDYVTFVSRIKENLAAGLPKEAAVNEATDYSIKHNLLNGFFHEQKMEVLNMSLFEFDQEEYDRNRFEEGKAVGVLEGKEEGWAEGIAEGEAVGITKGKAIGVAEGERSKALQDARNFKQKNISPEIIAECTGLSIEQVNML